MTWTAAGSWLVNDKSALATSNQAIGNLIVAVVYNYTNSTVWATGLSGGGATWVLAGVQFSGTTNNNSAAVFLGTVTATGAGTATPAWSGTAPAGYEITGHEFHSSVGSWAFDVQGNLDSAGTLSMPSLTPAANGELYFGMAGSLQESAGSTTGYVYNSDVTDGNAECYNLSCPAGTATFPVWGGTVASNALTLGIAVLIAETASGTNTSPAYATAFNTTAVAGTGTWVNPGNATGAADSSFATWTAP